MSNGAARYAQIADYLKELIAKAEPGDRLPSEAELCEKFGVSRMTARQAMQLVGADGTIERRRGAGTFVKEQPVPRDLGSPLSFTGSMRARGMTASSETLFSGEVEPSDDERDALEIGKGDKAYALERLRSAERKPMAIERVVMPVDLAESLHDGFEKGSLHDAFRAVDRRPSEAHAEVTARKATAAERRLLGLGTNGIIISERRTIFDQDGRPLERTETRYAASRYSFRAIFRQDES